MNYSPEYKESILRRILPPSNESPSPRSLKRKDSPSRPFATGGTKPGRMPAWSQEILKQIKINPSCIICIPTAFIHFLKAERHIEPVCGNIARKCIKPYRFKSPAFCELHNIFHDFFCIAQSLKVRIHGKQMYYKNLIILT